LKRVRKGDWTPEILKKAFLEILFRLSWQMLLLLVLFISIRTLVIFLLTPLDEINEALNTVIFILLPRWIIDFLCGILSGIFFAFVLGFLLQQIHINQKETGALSKKLLHSLDRIRVRRAEKTIIEVSRKQSNTQRFYLKKIRTLLTDGFNDEELRRLCYDEPDFRPVYEQLAQGMGKDRIIDKLIEYAEQRELIETLLALAKERNPIKYEKYRPYRVISTRNPRGS
jgi:hypothetical protein